LTLKTRREEKEVRANDKPVNILMAATSRKSIASGGKNKSGPGRNFQQKRGRRGGSKSEKASQGKRSKKINNM